MRISNSIYQVLWIYVMCQCFPHMSLEKEIIYKSLQSIFIYKYMSFEIPLPSTSLFIVYLLPYHDDVFLLHALLLRQQYLHSYRQYQIHLSQY